MMKKYYILILLSFLGSGAISQSLPYPIIFLHGWGGQSGSWSESFNYLSSMGLVNGGRLDYCLNYDNNSYVANKVIYSPTITNADIRDFVSNPTAESIPIIKGDFYAINFDVARDGTYDPLSIFSVESSQQAVVKQGVALSRAIQHVLAITGKNKVVLMAHSMGGLEAREYLANPANWQPQGHCVAKLVTTGTPHGGSNADFSQIALALFQGLDTYSDAVRDLRTSYAVSLHRGIYLFGGYENIDDMDDFDLSPLTFYNADVNCNGVLMDSITGLNQKTIPIDLEYSCIIGVCNDCPAGQEMPGDGIVSDSSANLNNFRPEANAKLFYYYNDQYAPAQIHTALQGQILENMEGLDEPGNYNLAYHIDLDKKYLGFITYGQDTDLYKFSVPVSGDFTIKITNYNSQLLKAEIVNAQGQSFGGIHDISLLPGIDFSQPLTAGDYYLKMTGVAVLQQDINRYDFKLHKCTAINVSVNSADGVVFTVSANGGDSPYLYSINDVTYVPDSSFTINTAGTYTLYVKDTSNCKGTATINVTPPIACNTLSSSGGQGTTIVTQQLGINPGVVNVIYSMYGVPDKLEVFYRDTLIATTGGLVSGSDSLQFIYNPPLGGPYYCTIKLSAPNSGTAWDFTAKCPDTSGVILVSPLPFNTFCSGSSFVINYTSQVANFLPGNVFTAQISNASGSFSSPVNIGTVTSTAANGNINVTIPLSTPTGTGYRIRVNSSSEPLTGIANAAAFKVLGFITPSLSINKTEGVENACTGSVVTFTSVLVNGATPSYQWVKNNFNISGATSSSYSSSTFAEGDIIKCMVKNNNSCDTLWYFSNAIVVHFGIPSTPSISISASANNTCQGTAVVFTATTTGIGPFLWKKNGITLATTSVPTYSTSNFITGDIITCTLSNTGYVCLSTASLTSNGISMAVIPKLTTSVSIMASRTVICQGDSVTFTAAGVNGGSPLYQWLKNGVVIPGATQQVYKTNSLVTGNAISCRFTSSLSCVTASVVTSSTLSVTVLSNISASVSIVQTTGSNPTCAGATLAFRATPVNGGNTPKYQWMKNGAVIAGATTVTYSSNAFANGDIIVCLMQSSITCNTLYRSSNPIQIVFATPVPTISISASSNNTCAGVSVIFTATTNGVGPYQWKKNGVNFSSTTLPTLSTINFISGDIFTCFLSNPSYSCIPTANVTSNGITMSVIPVSTPSVSITATKTAVCATEPTTFTATVTNGINVTYQWRKKGIDIAGATQSAYTGNVWSTSDNMSCRITTGASACTSAATLTSNTITLSVLTDNVPSVSIAQTAGTNPCCSGAALTFTATPTNGGSPKYQWSKNAVNIAGATLATYSSSTFANGDIIMCSMKSSITCDSSYKPSNSISIIIATPTAPSITISSSANNVCSGTAIIFTAVTNGVGPYQWKKNGTNLSNTTAPSLTISSLLNNDVITCVLSNTSYACLPVANVTSNSLTMSIIPKVTPTIVISATKDTICTGNTITFSSAITNGGIAGYQWKKSGANIPGATQAVYTDSNFVNGDIISCTMTSSLPCVSSTSKSSNNIVVTVFPPTVPSITITANAIVACPGTLITFTSVQTNGGKPAYQWKKNSINISGATSASYSSNALVNGDIISCTMTSSVVCLPQQVVSSNTVEMNISSSISPAVSITASTTDFCTASSITFTAIPSAGAIPPYQWKKNGVTVSTTTTPSYTTSSLTNNDTITCVLSYSGFSCVPLANRTSNPIIVGGLLPAPVISALGPTSFCNGGSVYLTTGPGAGSYQWRLVTPDGTLLSSISNATSNLYQANASGYYAAIATGTGYCGSPISNIIHVLTDALSSGAPVISASSSTICAGQSVSLTSNAANGNQWYLSNDSTGSLLTTINGQINPVFNVTAPGYYVATATTGNGACPSPMSNIILVVPKILNVWTGAVSTAWENTGNWSCGILPDQNTNVEITAGTVIINSDPVIKSLAIAPGVIISLNPGKNLTIRY